MKNANREDKNFRSSFSELIRDFFYELFHLNIDLIFALSVMCGILYAIFTIQREYDLAVSAQNKFYEQLSSQFLVVGLVDGIIVEYDSEPEEIIFMSPKTATINVVDSEKSNSDRKIIIIHCIESKLPKFK